MYNVEYDLILTATIFVENHLEAPPIGGAFVYTHILKWGRFLLAIYLL